jgi:tripartite-type tricarboxylate transporter receptor subunit TctC
MRCRHSLVARFLACVYATIAFAAGATSAQWPSKPIKSIVATTPGSAPDLVARYVAERLGASRWQPVIVDNKPSAAGRIAIEEFKRAANGGSAMVIAPASSMTLYSHVFQKLSYDVFNDFTPVSTVASTAFAFAVGSKVPPSVTNIETYVQWCKANAREAQCANPGLGSLPHFLAMMFAREANVDLAHIPYRGAAMQAAASGEASAALATEGTARAFHEAGKLRVLATTVSERSKLFPKSQTFRELGWTALVQREWFGAFMPARTPAAVAEKMAETIRAALQEPNMGETWEKARWSPDSTKPAQLKAAVQREHAFWGPIVKASAFTSEA